MSGAEDVAQLALCWPSMHEALGLIPSIINKVWWDGVSSEIQSHP